MAVDLDDNIARLLSERYLEKVSAREWAIAALEGDFDSKNLRMLASMLPIDAAFEVDEKERLALAELGWDRYPPYVYLIQYARRVAKEILSGETDVKAGSAELYHILWKINASFELGAWYAIDELLDYNEYRGVKTTDEEIATYIKQACEDFLRKTDSNFGELPGTTFEQAEAFYKNFLKSNNINSNLSWIFREDVIADGWDVSIRMPLPADNRNVARQCFELGKRRDLGMRIATSFTVNGEPCCFIDLPEDSTDSMYRQMGSRYIKFTFNVDLRDAREIRNPVLWAIKKSFESKGGYRWRIDDIPSRQTLLPKNFK